MSDSFKVERPQYSDYDLYATLMLSNLLDNEQDAKDKKLLQPVQKEKEKEKEREKDQDQELVDTNDVIWVPADKHPQIAPIEFANFIKTHGTKLPTKSGRLHRRRSILSQSLSVKSTNDTVEDDDEADLNRTLSEKKRNFLKKVMADKDVFDRHSPILDESRIIAPKNDKSLLRRSAFSARGRTKKSAEDGLKRRSVSQRKSSSSDTNDTEKNQSWDKKAGIDLFDQPVNMSEWIDLGSLVQENDNSQRGILSRVHDAESQLRSNTQQEPPTTTTTTTTIPRPVVKIKEPIVPPKVLVILKENQHQPQKQLQQPTKRPSIARSPTVVVKPEKRSSWLSGLFPSNNNKKSIPSNNNTSSSLSGLATLFSRSLSMKSNLPTLSTLHSPPLSTHKSSIHITTTNNTIIKSSSPLSSPSPSPPLQESKLSPSRLDEPTVLFNTNRLPLHVERAIYRLSHMKLADPRRPLHQQVLISNLMFWYLSIQQNDFQQQEKVQQESPQPTITSQPNNKKIGNKMSRLISSAKKRKKSNNSNNLQFNLNTFEEDDIPLSHYQS